MHFDVFFSGSDGGRGSVGGLGGGWWKVLGFGLFLLAFLTGGIACFDMSR